jgi:inner membrane protein
MDQFIDTWTGLGFWRWFALAALLFAVELTTGTAYLLWLSAAAVMTGIVIALPGEINFATELLLFGVFAIGSTLFGRRFFPPSAITSDQPDLNNPMLRHIGARAVAIGDFSGGQGRVALGDTQWGAQTRDGSNPSDGTGLEVVSVNGTTLYVQAGDQQ